MLIGISSDKHVRHVTFFSSAADLGALNREEKRPGCFRAALLAVAAFSTLPVEDPAAAVAVASDPVILLP